MQSKKKMLFLSVLLGVFIAYTPNVYADDDIDMMDDTEVVQDVSDASADAVEKYDITGSLFQQITDLEQEKVLMQLEKERAQLDLELDRLAAEKIKLHMEIDTLSGRAEQQQQEFEMEKAKLENETAKLELERQNLASGDSKSESKKSYSKSSSKPVDDDDSDFKIIDKYKLVNVVGAGNQLQATVSDLDSGQTKKITVGRVLDGFTVKSISLDEGIVFAKDGKTQTLNISSAK